MDNQVEKLNVGWKWIFHSVEDLLSAALANNTLRLKEARDVSSPKWPASKPRMLQCDCLVGAIELPPQTGKCSLHLPKL
ncbi:hypothetical protein CFP56_015263 [Quercus suber]|uniref:Uncharacterized protein n=1 Tax=Quercus suber TaxID=58331 RepID=A0AAW0M3P6_QUESU